MVEAVEDAEVTTHAMKYLDEAAADYLAHGTTFYLGVGLHKPHLVRRNCRRRSPDPTPGLHCRALPAAAAPSAWGRATGLHRVSHDTVCR